MKSPVHHLHKAPLLLIASCFIIGILLYSFFVRILIVPVIFVVILMTTIILHRQKKFSNIVEQSFNYLIPSLICITGYLSYQLRVTTPSEIKETNAIYIGYVTEELKSTEKYSDYIIQLESSFQHDSIISINEKVHFRGFDTNQNQILKPGSRISFKGQLTLIRNQGNLGEFDYQSFMANKNIFYKITCFQDYTSLQETKFTIKIFANQVRAKLLSKLSDYKFSTESFAIISALTLGDKSQLSSEIKQNFSNSGAMHVLAVSGLHVGILFVLFSSLFNYLFPQAKLRILRILLLITMLWIYAFITGLAPSVMRSATMFSLIAIGQNLKRHVNVYNSIGASALILMVINPKVIYEVGFQLSYLALIAIVFFQPRIANLWKPKLKIVQRVWQLIAVSVAAQIGTAPITIFYFHQFPVYFWLSNLLVIPAAAIILYSTILFFVFSGIPFLAAKIAFLLDHFVSLINLGVQKICMLPHAIVENLWISPISAMLIYALIFLIMLLIISRMKKFIFYFLIIGVIHSSIQIIHDLNLLNQRQCIIYNSYAPLLVSIIDGQHHYYYTNKDSLDNFDKRLLNQTSGIKHTLSPVPIQPNLTYHPQHDSAICVISYDSLTLITSGYKAKLPPLSIINHHIKFSNKKLYFNHVSQEYNSKKITSEKNNV